jgi:hypothetical protein
MKVTFRSNIKLAALVTIQVTGTFAQISNATRNLRRMKVHFEQY